MTELEANRVTVRRGTAEDAPLIGLAVAMGIGMDEVCNYAGDRAVDVLAEVARLPESQYSYHNAMIAMVDGHAVGACVGYDGARLHSLREGTLSVLRKYKPDIEITDDETAAGEFYLDTVAVLPGHRGMGIGRKLIEAMTAYARHCGHRRVGLLVDSHNPDAERLYRSMGFIQEGNRRFFGIPMKHLVLNHETSPLVIKENIH